MIQQRRAWGIGLVLAGVVLLLETLAVLDLWAAGGWWPLLLVVVGFVLVVRDSGEPVPSWNGSRIAVLASRDALVRAQPYHGGRITVLLGHVDYDLRDTIPGPDGADLVVGVLLGDVAVTVPPGWRVDVQPRRLLAAVDEELLPAANDPPTVTIRGTVILGDLHVRTGSIVV